MSPKKDEPGDMRTEYAWEKLHVAVSILAAGSGTLMERVKDAHVSSLIRLQADDFSDADTRNRFTILMDEISPQGRSDVALAMWSEEDLRRLAEGVVSLYDAVARRNGRHGPLKDRWPDHGSNQ
jgi:hypothetical protein